ncbi:hypothetical protein ACWKWU_16535 [Chitinophaga lutea]
MRVLHKIFSRQFYLRNVGFFLVLFYLLFGVVESTQLVSYHYSLIKGFMTKPAFLAVVLLLWGLYGIKCIAFVLKAMQSPDHGFLYQTLGCLDRRARWRIWWTIQAAMYLPVLIYGGIGAIVGANAGSIVVTLFNLGMCLWPALLYERKLARPDLSIFSGALQRWVNRRFTKPPWLYWPYELTVHHARALLTTKLYSAGVLWITFYLLRETGGYDVRGMLLGTMVCVLLHVPLLIRQRDFEDKAAVFLRQLPVSLFRRFGWTGAAWLLLLLPEICLLFNNLPDQTDLPVAAVLAWCMLMLFRSILYFSRLDAEKFIRWVLVISFVTLFLMLAGWTWAVAAAMLCAAAAIFVTRYGRYEPAAAE